MTNDQAEYIEKHIGVVKGMLVELDVRQKNLQAKLRQRPQDHEEINEQFRHLEGEADALMVTLNFIENWPTGCPAVQSGNCENCKHSEVCPVAKGICKHPAHHNHDTLEAVSQ